MPININEDDYTKRLKSLIEVLHIDTDKVKILIETGTNLADGTTTFSEIFDYVYTIELSEKLFNYCIENKHRSNIDFRLGKSTDILKSIISNINQEYALFLDAHGSGGDTAYDEDVGRFDSPVIEELEQVKDNPPEVIIIDDLYLFEEQKLNYPTVDSIISKVNEIGKYSFVKINWSGQPQWLCFIRKSTCT